MADFRKSLETMINDFSKENGSSTPDFILAQYLCDCLDAFDKAVVRRSAWYAPPKANNEPDPVGPQP